MKKMTKLLTAAIAGIMGASFAGSSLRADEAKTTDAKPAVEKNACKGEHGCKAHEKNKKAKKGEKANSCKGHHDCKGKNDCKGKGGCHTDKNSCAGKNECKGKGGCKSSMKKSDNNACQGKDGCAGMGTKSAAPEVAPVIGDPTPVTTATPVKK